MTITKYKTNLRCGACVESIRPLFDAEPRIQKWTADVSTPDKLLTIEATGMDRQQVDRLLQQKGYQILAEVPVASPSQELPATPTVEEPKPTYYPLLLILFYIVGVVGLVEYTQETFDWMRAMNHFMAGFFLVFSFFKLLNLSAFADAYAGYDIVAARWRIYGLIYPFIELTLGIAYLIHFEPIVTNLVTFLVMGISTVGVVQSLLAKRKIRCACLGNVFNLPMSYVTLTEDLLMVGMALTMLITLGLGIRL